MKAAVSGGIVRGVQPRFEPRVCQQTFAGRYGIRRVVVSAAHLVEGIEAKPINRRLVVHVRHRRLHRSKMEARLFPPTVIKQLSAEG
jgi:hypothetical protein